MTETTQTELAAEFDRQRSYLVAVAYRMLGSRADAEDAVQEAWFRLRRQDSAIGDLRAWLTRVVSRISLDLLRSRGRRREDPLVEDAGPGGATAVGPSGPSAVAAGAAMSGDPALRAEQVDRVTEALVIVLDRLSPEERLAYVLHDVFGLPFDDIAGILDRTPQATRKLASRARERVRGADDVPGRPRATKAQQRAVVEAFLEAAGSGDVERLVRILHPDVVFRIDEGAEGVRVVRGPEQIAHGATAFRTANAGTDFRIVESDGRFGVLSRRPDGSVALLLFTVEGDRIVAMQAAPATWD
ncbi:sigma-70 family RNA polymerase sigma factor [Leifsonia sp. NPDC080035]|uniref:Sigma-70 family RNA polymerase sigma factor n=1 Tax=Leifsonia sp. NPDC080035 TaxID=3143936 RepID=A0AAU7G7Y5_9MICO